MAVNVFPEALSRGATLLKRLSTLGPGQRLNVSRYEFQDIMVVPDLNPLNRLTVDERADWLCERLPFRCRHWQRADDGMLVFERETANAHPGFR